MADIADTTSPAIITDAVGRPSKYTPETIAIVIEGLRKGYSRQDCCKAARISDETFSNWCKQHLDFLDAVQNAEFECKQESVDIIRRAGMRTWTAAAWWLERKHRDEFALRREFTGADGDPIAIEISLSKDEEQAIEDAMIYASAPIPEGLPAGDVAGTIVAELTEDTGGNSEARDQEPGVPHEPVAP